MYRAGSARSEPRLVDGSQLSVVSVQRRVEVRKQQKFSHNRVCIGDVFSNHKTFKYFMGTFLYPHITALHNKVVDVKWIDRNIRGENIAGARIHSLQKGRMKK